VDGFHPINVGRLVQNRATLVAATPSGIVELLQRSNITIAGAHAVVVGRSDIVGKPIALLLLHRNATVTVCHSRTANLPRVAAEADLLVVAIGRAAFVTKEFVKPGAAVIDVGMNRLVDRAEVERIFAPGSKGRQNFERRGSVLVGDVHPDVAEVAGALTPVPGGVGPLTIAMLLKNTLRAAEERLDRSGGSGGSGGSGRSGGPGGSGRSGGSDRSGGAGSVQRASPDSLDRPDSPDRPDPPGRPDSPGRPDPPDS